MKIQPSKAKPGLYFCEDGSILLSTSRPGDPRGRLFNRVLSASGVAAVMRDVKAGMSTSEVPYQHEVSPRLAKMFLSEDAQIEYNNLLEAGFFYESDDGDNGVNHT